ncbi:MAG: DUF2752 domain-containing protein [Clostridia bacterium]|nr:DUF2752 domain-containing protein [Clostridia bacterium]
MYRLWGGLCVFRLVTSVPCPGCGMTRAALCVLRGAFSEAFSYHPLWVTLPVIALLVFSTVFPSAASRVLSRLHISGAAYLRAEGICAVLLLVLFLAVWIVRLFCGWDGITPV